MLQKSLQKLLDNEHIVFLDNLPAEKQEEILNSKSSYTIPSDVAFKEASVSTPARWVFDAGSKSPTGYPLNDLLAKGTIDLIKLVNMVLGWRIGASAFTGGIQMFYNSILLHQDHWKYQKILINPDLDPDSKVLIAVITTLIYGVRPVGNQCEEGIKLLAMEVREKFQLAADLLLVKRYVDDLGDSMMNEEKTDSIIKEITRIL